MARSHTKHGISWQDIVHIALTRKNVQPLGRNPEARLRLAVHRQLDRAADCRIMASLPSQYTSVDGMPPKTAYLHYCRLSIAQARKLNLSK